MVSFQSLLVLLNVFLLMACAENKKTVPSVFPENYKKIDVTNCRQASQNRISNQFIVTWENGKISKERSENATLFEKKFLEPNLKKIKHVEFDKKIRLIRPHTEINDDTKSLALVSNDWGQQMVQASNAWEQNIKGDGVIVAVIDTAIDKEHPLIKNRFIAGWDFVSNSTHPGYSEDMNEHATHVAGIIAGEEGVAGMHGIAPKSKVLGISFLDKEGFGELSDSLTSMKLAADSGAKIINNSWGGGDCSQTMKSVMVDLEQRGVLIVVASGNEHSDLEEYPSYPAAFNTPFQLTVAASESIDVMASFSNHSWNLVHLAAPGSRVYSAIPGGQYAELSGTSMATPFVSGAAALLLSARPNASPAQLKQALLESVDVKSYRVLTQGRLNVSKALEQIKKLVQ